MKNNKIVLMYLILASMILGSVACSENKKSSQVEQSKKKLLKASHIQLAKEHGGVIPVQKNNDSEKIMPTRDGAITNSLKNRSGLVTIQKKTDDYTINGVIDTSNTNVIFKVPRNTKLDIKNFNKAVYLILEAQNAIISKNYILAKDYLRRALSLVPQMASAYALRGTANFKLHNRTAAIKDWKTSLKIYPNQPKVKALIRSLSVQYTN